MHERIYLVKSCKHW